MPIEYLEYDAVELFKEYQSPCVFAHGANCQNTMNSGIAKDIKNNLPELYNRDQKTIRGDRSKLGTFSHIQLGDKFAFNLYTQFRYGTEIQHFDYEAFESAFVRMRQYLLAYDVDLSQVPLIIPKIGCGLGGGDWKIVTAMLYDMSKNDSIIVCIKE